MVNWRIGKLEPATVIRRNRLIYIRWVNDPGEIYGGPDPSDPEEPDKRPTKIRIKLADGKERSIQHMVATSF